MFDRLREKLGDFRKSIDEKLKASPPRSKSPCSKSHETRS